MKKKAQLFEIKKEDSLNYLYFKGKSLGVIHDNVDDLKFCCEFDKSHGFLFDLKISDLPHEISFAGRDYLYNEIRLKRLVRNGKRLRFTFLIWGGDFRKSYLSGERFIKEYYKTIKNNPNFETKFEEADNPPVDNEPFNALEIFISTGFTDETTVKEKLDRAVSELKIIYNALALKFGKEIVKKFEKK